MPTLEKLRNRASTAVGLTGASSHRWGSRLINAGPMVALLVLAAVFSIASATFLTGSNLATIGSQLSILLVLAVGMTFVILLGSIDLSTEGVMAASSLIFVLLAGNDRNGNNFGWLAVAAGIGTGALFGLINGVLHVKLRIPSFMVTLGTGAVGIGVATVLFGGQPPRLMDHSLRAWGVGSWLGVSALLYVALSVLVVALLIQKYTRVGRYGYVIGGDEEIASLSGINVKRYKVGAFVLSGTAAGLAGVMASAQLDVGDVQIGKNLLFTTISAVVVGGTLLSGGRGGVLKTLVGSLIIVVLANGLILVGVSPEVQIAVQSVVIVSAVVMTGWPLRRRVRVVK
jgi:ribose transport system permease protein